MKTGPHRKFQLLNSSSLITSLADDGTPRSSKAPTTLLPSTNLGLSEVSGRSTDDYQSKTPTKRSEQGTLNTSPRIIQKTIHSSVSASNIVQQHMNLAQSATALITKSYQPILKKGEPKTPTVSLRKQEVQYSTVESKSDSNPRSGSKPVVSIKEQPFNYQERQVNNQKSADHMMDIAYIPEQTLKDVSKVLVNQYEGSNHFKKLNTNKVFIESLNESDDIQEVRMRPSGDVSQDHMIINFGSGFTHSRFNSGQNNWTAANNIKEIDTFNEEIKSDMRQEDESENFEVIKEDIKDNISPYGHIGRRHNSDMKSFGEDEQEYFNQVMKSHWAQQLGNSLDHSENKMMNKGSVQMQIQEEDTPVKDNKVAVTSSNTLQTFNSGEAAKKQSDPIASQAHILSFCEENTDFNQDTNNQTQLDMLTSFNFESRPQSYPLKTAQVSSQQLNQNGANAIIEIEKNYVIMQYESLLSQLSVEFERVLSKTKETDEHLAAQELQIQDQLKLINEKDAAQFQQEQINAQLSSQVQDLLQEFEVLTIEKQRMAESQNEAQAIDQDYLQQEIFTLQSKVRLYESSEVCLKDQIDTTKGQMRSCEAKLRQMEEEVFLHSRENSSILRDLQNMKEIEKSLNQEIHRGQTARVSLEEAVQEMRQRTCTDQIIVRLRENEIENITHEFKVAKGTLDTLQLNYTQVMRENDQMKGSLNEHERSSIQMKSIFQTRDSQTSQLENDVQRLTAIIEKERQRSNKVEEDYRKKIESLQNELRDTQHKHKFESTQQSTFNRTNEHGETQRIMVNSNNGEGLVSRNRTSLNDYANIEELDQKAQISWIYAKPEQIQPISSVVPQAQSISSNDRYQRESIQKRQTYNTGQDHQQSYEGIQSNLQNYRSSERTSIAVNSYPQRSSIDQSQQQQYRVQPPQMALESHFSPKQGGFLKMNQFQQQSDPEINYFPAAGKKSTTETSPFSVTQENIMKQVAFMQSSLSVMQIDKEKIENEYRKLGTSKNKMQIDKKRELEFEIEEVNKNIHQIKQKLREMNAF